MSVVRAQRHRTENYVCNGFSKYPTNTKHDIGAKLSIANNACNEFAAAFHHGSDEHFHFPIGWHRRSEQIINRFAYIIDCLQVQLDETTLGFMGDGRATELCNHGQAHVGQHFVHF